MNSTEIVFLIYSVYISSNFLLLAPSILYLCQAQGFVLLIKRQTQRAWYSPYLQGLSLVERKFLSSDKHAVSCKFYREQDM